MYLCAFPGFAFSEPPLRFGAPVLSFLQRTLGTPKDLGTPKGLGTPKRRSALQLSQVYDNFSESINSTKIVSTPPHAAPAL